MKYILYIPTGNIVGIRINEPEPLYSFEDMLKAYNEFCLHLCIQNVEDIITRIISKKVYTSFYTENNIQFPIYREDFEIIDRDEM